MARVDPQLKLRVTEKLKDLLVNAAHGNNRSVNAEIVARIEAYDAIYEHMRELAGENERLTGELTATKEALEEQKRISQGLQKLINENFEKARFQSENEQEAMDAIEKRYNELQAQIDYLESLKAEVITETRKRKTDEDKTSQMFEIVSNEPDYDSGLKKLTEALSAEIKKSNEQIFTHYEKLMSSFAKRFDEKKE